MAIPGKPRWVSARATASAHRFAAAMVFAAAGMGGIPSTGQAQEAPQPHNIESQAQPAEAQKLHIGIIQRLYIATDHLCALTQNLERNPEDSLLQEAKPVADIILRLIASNQQRWDGGAPKSQVEDYMGNPSLAKCMELRAFLANYAAAQQIPVDKDFVDVSQTTPQDALAAIADALRKSPMPGATFVSSLTTLANFATYNPRVMNDASFLVAFGQYAEAHETWSTAVALSKPDLVQNAVAGLRSALSVAGIALLANQEWGLDRDPKGAAGTVFAWCVLDRMGKHFRDPGNPEHLDTLLKTLSNFTGILDEETRAKIAPSIEAFKNSIPNTETPQHDTATEPSGELKAAAFAVANQIVEMYPDLAMPHASAMEPGGLEPEH